LTVYIEMRLPCILTFFAEDSYSICARGEEREEDYRNKAEGKEEKEGKREEAAEEENTHGHKRGTFENYRTYARTARVEKDWTRTRRHYA
jgi:hypothetical protein